MVQFVGINIREKLGQLVIAISSVSIILNLEVTEPQKGKGSPVPWRELKLIVEDIDNLVILLISD